MTGPFERVVADIEAMVRVIGRGEPATSDSDAAVDRLGSLFANHRSGSVPVLSILYQNFDATTALVGTSMLATATGRAAAPAVPRTRRVALDNTYLAGRTIPAGTEVTLEIGAAGLPFCAGPHQCPGQALAERIVAAITSTIHDAGYRVDATNATFDADGRPISLPMRLFLQPVGIVDATGRLDPDPNAHIDGDRSRLQGRSVDNRRDANPVCVA